MSSSIRTFNSAKKFAEEVLHPLIDTEKNAKIVTRLGAISNEEAQKMTSKQRVINRFNALKERIILQQTLINQIEATVRLNKTVCEIELIESIKIELENLEKNFEERHDEIIYSKYYRGTKTPVLTDLFKDLCIFLDKTYVHIQRLMTKNKLLFSSDNDDFLEDRELKDKIKFENRSA